MSTFEMFWSDSPRMKYRVSRSESGYAVERLRKKRVRQEDQYSDYVWFTYEFRMERTYYLQAPDYRCDPDYCAQAYYLGYCEHEALVDTLHASWSKLRTDYERQVRNKLYRLVAQLRDAVRCLLEWQAALPAISQCRLVQGSYILFLPDFLSRFSLRQLTIILQAIRYPLTPEALTDVGHLIDDACRFNAAQWILSARSA